MKKLSSSDRKLMWNMFGTLFVKGLGLILSIIITPAYIRFFNDDITLGLWFTVLSVLNWMLYFDFGIGNGLRNCLTKSLAAEDQVKAKQYISSAYVSIGVICLACIGLFLPVSYFVNWNILFNITVISVSQNALHVAVCIVFLTILLQLFLRLISSFFYAIQKAVVNNILGFISSLLQVIALYILPSSSNDSNLVVMAIAHLVAVLFPMAIATVFVFANKKYKDISPSIKYFNFSTAKEVLSLGSVFLIAQILYMVIMNTNEYLITLFVGSEHVVDYQIYHKLFTLPGTLFMLFLVPLWSAVTKALAEKRHKWVRSLYNKILLLATICSVCVFFIIPLAQPVVNVWLAERTIDINLSIAFAFAVLASLMIINTVFSTFSNGIGDLKIQIICFTLGSIIKIPLAYLFTMLFGSWVGVIWSNSISLILYCIIQPFYLNKYMKNSIKENQE